MIPQRSERGLIGRSLGDFVVREKLGEGGGGAVYRAEQPLLGREAVVKVLHEGAAASEDATERFLREARLASTLDHPFAAHIYAFGAEDDGLLWIAMERVKGTPLDTLLKSKGALALERFVPLLTRICEVVHTAHEQAIIHRDLKPANVMVLSRAGRLLPKLLDFGIAKLRGAAHEVRRAPPPAATGPGQDRPARSRITAERLSQSVSVDLTHEGGHVIGSPHFMAPEQWVDAASVDARTDIYALGALCHQALTGRPPFAGEDLMSLARAHASTPPPALPAPLPPALSAVLARAMAKDPEARYPTVLQFAEAFRTAAGIGDEALSLPHLDEPLLQQVVSEAPRPIAEAAAALEAAASVGGAWQAAWALFATAIRYVGVLALAARGRTGPGGDQDDLPVREDLRRLRLEGLTERAWAQLSARLVRRFSGRQELHPLPELVAFFDEGKGPLGLPAPLADLLAHKAELGDGKSVTEEELRARLPRLLSELEALLQGLAFLAEYQLVVPGTGAKLGQRWMGTRRSSHPTLVLPAGATLEAGRPVLLDAVGGVAMSLWPLLQVLEPSPGVPREVFLLGSPGRYGARLEALPLEFERQDEAPWAWMREQLGVGGEDRSASDEGERAPYLGLAAFTAADASNFFGREREAQAFVNRLRVTPLLAVVGASGAGKSSFVQAGVASLLPESWRMMVVRPGPTPFQTLQERLVAEAGPVGSAPLLEGGILSALRQRAASLPADGKLVLVIDQFEELITLCLDEDERTRFALAVADAALEGQERLRVVLTLRDDFLMRVQQLPGMRELLGQGLQLVNTPAPEELKRIVVEPARRAGYTFEPAGLPDQMVEQVASQPGALALLSFTASKLWELRDRHYRQLTRRAYEALGGVGGALAQHAEEMLSQTPEQEQPLVREVFRHLVTAEGTRAVLTRDELRQVLASPELAEPVLERLIRSRLLVASEGGPAGSERVEVTHEALLHAWPRLVRWRQEDAESARLKDELRAAARQWDQKGRPRGLLWREEALAEYRVWRQRYPGRLTDVEEAFARASVGAESRARRVRRSLLIAAFVLLAVGVAVLLRMNERAANRLTQLYQEQGRQALLGDGPQRALAFLGQAWARGADNPSLRFMLSRALVKTEGVRFILKGGGRRFESLDLSDDGRRVLGSGEDGEVRVWDTTSGDLVGAIHLQKPAPDRLVSAVLSPDGRSVASIVDRDNSAQVFELPSGRLLATLEHPSAFVLAFSPDGSVLATVGRDGNGRIWDVGTYRLRAVLPSPGDRKTEFVAFSADGRRCLTGGRDHKARVWDVQTGRLVSVLEGHGEGDVFRGALSKDGRLAVTGTSNADYGVRLFEADTGRLLWTSSLHNRSIFDVQLSPDGSAVLTASEDGVARLLEVATGKERVSFLPPASSALRTARFSPDGQRVVTGATNGLIRVFDVVSGVLLTTLVGHTDIVSAVEHASDGRTLVSSGIDSTVRVWSLESAGAPRLAGHRRPAWAALVAEGERRVISVGEDGLVVSELDTGRKVTGEQYPAPDQPRLSVGALSGDRKVLAVAWDVPAPGDGAAPAGPASKLQIREPASLRVTRELVGSERPINRVLLDGAGTRVVTASEDGTVRVIELASARELMHFSTGVTVWALAISPDDLRLAAGVADGTIHLWDLRSGQPIRVLTGHTRDLTGLAFHPDGHRLVSAAADKTARIWDLATGEVKATLLGHTAELLNVAVSEDGEFVLTAGDDGTVRVWDAESGAQLDVVLRRRNGVTSVEEAPRLAALVSTTRDGEVDLVPYRIQRPLEDRAWMAARLACVPFRFAEERLIPYAPEDPACLRGGR